MTNSTLFVTCPKGLEGLLLTEIRELGAREAKETLGGVYCEGQLETLYKICLWSRLANRVYLALQKREVHSTKDCYDLCASIKWETILKVPGTIAVDFRGASEFIRNTIFGAQLIKDAVVDRIQKTQNRRCRVDLEKPDCLIHARLHHNELSIFYDLSGHSLHQRGYRKESGEAPMKENLAAAMVLRSGWPKVMNRPLIDPFCGSGTLLIEAAMMASQKAPGLDRMDYGFLNWMGHDDTLWNNIQEEALERHEAAMDSPLPRFYGYDADPKAVKNAARNIKAAGFSECIQVEPRGIHDFKVPKECAHTFGFIIANPPYGERLSDSESLIETYEDLGRVIKGSGWPAAVLTSDPMLARSTGLRSHKQYALVNGKIPCKLFLFEPRS